MFFQYLRHQMEKPVTSWERELAAALPKIELHLHLDGSLSTGTPHMLPVWLDGYIICLNIWPFNTMPNSIKYLPSRFKILANTKSTLEIFAKVSPNLAGQYPTAVKIFLEFIFKILLLGGPQSGEWNFLCPRLNFAFGFIRWKGREPRMTENWVRLKIGRSSISATSSCKLKRNWR